MSAPAPSAACWPISRLLALFKTSSLAAIHMDIWARMKADFILVHFNLV